MDINQLNCFITVAQTLNFSEAARRNYVSQSTVSRYVSDLEKEFGVQLFTRSHRDVIITSEGKALLPYAIEIVETLKKAKTVIKQMHDGGQGKITLGCDVTSLSFPAKCIADFAEKYPGITITHNETLSVVTAKNSKFSGRKSVKLSELADESILVLSESVAPIVYMEIIDLFRTFHITPKISNSFDDLVSIYVSSSSGIGVSVIPTSVAAYTSDEYTDSYLIDDADTSIAYVMAWGKNISNPAAKLFMEAVKKYAKGDDNIYGL